MAEPYTVYIRDNKTGEVSEYGMKTPDGYEFSEYIWSEGNYACNCNRSLFFWRGRELPEEEVWKREASCGDGRYSVKIVRPDGTVLYEEA